MRPPCPKHLLGTLYSIHYSDYFHSVLYNSSLGEVYFLPQALGFYAVCFIPLLTADGVLPETQGGEGWR